MVGPGVFFVGQMGFRGEIIFSTFQAVAKAGFGRDQGRKIKAYEVKKERYP